MTMTGMETRRSFIVANKSRPSHSRHAHVRHHATSCVVVGGVEKSLRGKIGAADVTLGRHQQGQRIPNRRVIIDDMDGCAVAHGLINLVAVHAHSKCIDVRLMTSR